MDNKTSLGTVVKSNPETNGTIRVSSSAYVMYRGEKVPVVVESTYDGNYGKIANVKAITGFPFYSSDVEAQGDTFGLWNCNGLRVRADFVKVESSGFDLEEIAKIVSRYEEGCGNDTADLLASIR